MSLAATDPVNDEPTLRDVMSQVAFAPSCLDMGWDWDVTPTTNTEGPSGWFIRCSFQRPDTDTGKVGRGFGRWWIIESGTTVGGVVKTMWAACKMIVEHELHEAFLYRGARVFDPHADVDRLRDANRRVSTSALGRVLAAWERDSGALTEDELKVAAEALQIPRAPDAFAEALRKANDPATGSGALCGACGKPLPERTTEWEDLTVHVVCPGIDYVRIGKDMHPYHRHIFWGEVVPGGYYSRHPEVPWEDVVEEARDNDYIIKECPEEGPDPDTGWPSFTVVV